MPTPTTMGPEAPMTTVTAIAADRPLTVARRCLGPTGSPAIPTSIPTPPIPLR